MRRQPIFLLLAAVCLMAACTHKKTTAESEAAVSPTETVKAIYEDLLPHYLSGEAMHETEWSAEKKYCSQEWLRRREADMAEASQTGNASAIDYDPWLSAQDWDTDLALYDVTLYKKLGADTAWVKVCLQNCGSLHDVYLSLVHEENEWRVDDFPYEWEDHWLSAKENLPK